VHSSGIRRQRREVSKVGENPRYSEEKGDGKPELGYGKASGDEPFCGGVIKEAASPVL
jgi:hypothetical protein